MNLTTTASNIFKKLWVKFLVLNTDFRISLVAVLRWKGILKQIFMHLHSCEFYSFIQT